MAAKDLYEKDFYKVLGVDKKASADEIKKKYRSLARDLHPDKNQGDTAREEKFKAVADQLAAITTRIGLEKYGTAGDAFDPQIHEALLHDTSSDVAISTASKILQPGYKYKERILRPARVAVTDPEVAVEEPVQSE